MDSFEITYLFFRITTITTITTRPPPINASIRTSEPVSVGDVVDSVLVVDVVTGVGSVLDVVVIDDAELGINGASRRPIFTIVRDGRLISSCVSVRENDESAECYTFTEEGFRQLGLGRQVTTAWGRHQLLRGKIPFYSHEKDNSDSLALANSLNLEWKFRLVAFH